MTYDSLAKALINESNNSILDIDKELDNFNKILESINILNENNILLEAIDKEAIKEKFKKIITNIINFFKKIRDWFKDKLDKIKKWIKEKFSKLKLKEADNKINKLKNEIKNIHEDVQITPEIKNKILRQLVNFYQKDKLTILIEAIQAYMNIVVDCLNQNDDAEKIIDLLDNFRINKGRIDLGFYDDELVDVGTFGKNNPILFCTDKLRIYKCDLSIEYFLKEFGGQSDKIFTLKNEFMDSITKSLESKIKYYDDMISKLSKSLTINISDNISSIDDLLGKLNLNDDSTKLNEESLEKAKDLQSIYSLALRSLLRTFSVYNSFIEDYNNICNIIVEKFNNNTKEDDIEFKYEPATFP